MFGKFIGPYLYRDIKEYKDGKRNVSDNFMLASVKKYENIHQGERCFVLGNGPSLKKISLSVLKEEYTFSVNQLPRNPEFKSLNTTYHLWSDRIFFELNSKSLEDMELLDIMKSVDTEENHPVVFYEIMAKPMIEEFKLQDFMTIEYFKCIGLDLDLVLKKKLDFTHSIPNMPTVVQTAICLAVYMGFSEIYLLGCDCTGFMNIAKNKLMQGENTDYGYEISANEKRRMEKVACQRPIREELLSYARLLDVYELLRIYCNNNGIELFNATSGGLLEGIPRVHLSDILK